MTRPWKTLARWSDGGAVLELRQRGESDFLILDDGRVLMNSYSRKSEEELSRLGLAHVQNAKKPWVLIAGLGMGFTLRAALDVLPPDALVTVCELNPVVVDWCRGPLAEATRSAIDEPRVELVIDDVAALIARQPFGALDAILLDLYEGPNAASQRRDDPFYGQTALDRTRTSLKHGGVLAVWSEDADAAFEKRLAGTQFAVVKHSIGMGGRKHIVYVGTKLPAKGA